MGFDTKYRPLKYKDVLGQEGTVEILKRRVELGKARHNSYRFAGPSGCGKTTLARILARAILCESPKEGEACDACDSCRAMLEGPSVDFVEVDAATKSGKDDVRRIVESLQYVSLSGRRVIYLFDEAHQLSKDAFAALLKSMEDPVPGTHDKKLVCIFCTTAPEKMEHAVAGRCGPTFAIRPPSVEAVVQRLSEICWREKIQYEDEALRLIAEITECGVREAVNALDGVSVLGDVTVERVSSYLSLDANAACVGVLSAIGNEEEALREVKGVLAKISPASAYETLAKAALLAYQTHIGAVSPPGHWNKDSLEELGREKGADLLAYAHTFSCRLGKPTPSMLVCDILVLSRYGIVPAAGASGPLPFALTSPASEATPAKPRKPKKKKVPRPPPGQPVPTDGKHLTKHSRIYTPPNVLQGKRVGGAPVEPRPRSSSSGPKMSEVEAFRLFEEGVAEGKRQALRSGDDDS